MYLTPDDLAAFGLPATTTAPQIRTASAIVDSYLSRPEGLIWQPDYTGQPCCMAALKPTISFTLGADIAPGAAVVASIGANINLNNNLGDVFILDQDDPTKIEAVYVAAAQPGQVTLRGVTIAHAAGASMRGGLTIKEERALPSGRNITQAMKGPIRRLISAFGRYDYGRRNEQNTGWFQEISLLTMVSSFGGPPVWQEISLVDVSTSDATDEIWFPAGILIAYFNSVRYSYIVGFASAAAVPAIVKNAVAGIIGNATAFPELTGNVKSLKAGDSAVTRFSDSVLDATTRAQLDAFKARMWV
jgi:hypothetical protein